MGALERLRGEKRSRRRPAVAVVTSLAGVAAVAGATVLRRRRGDGTPDASVAELDPSTADEAPSPRHRHWACECGQEYRVTGEDRHQVFWLDGAAEDDPVLGDRCPECDRPLPHHGAAETAA